MEYINSATTGFCVEEVVKYLDVIDYYNEDNFDYLFNIALDVVMEEGVLVASW